VRRRWEEVAVVATSLNNLAELLRAQGKNDDAGLSLVIMRKVCAIHLATSSRDYSCKALVRVIQMWQLRSTT
jgi:hypothetical protein